MSSYDQGRMDAWERIDALKRRLGLLGFFNEQKIKRYPKGHPKAGEFMPKPKDPVKTKISNKIFTDAKGEISTVIDGHTFTITAPIRATGTELFASNTHTIAFLANGSTLMDKNIDEKTGKKAAFWWRRQSLDLPKKLPEGTILDCSAEDQDGEGAYRLRFYKALGFRDVYGDDTLYAKVKGGKLSPASEADIENAKSKTLVNREEYRSTYSAKGRIESKRAEIKKRQEEIGDKVKALSRAKSPSDRGIAKSDIRDLQFKVKWGRRELSGIKEKIEKNKEVSSRLKRARAERASRPLPPSSLSSIPIAESEIATTTKIPTASPSRAEGVAKLQRKKGKGK